MSKNSVTLSFSDNTPELCDLKQINMVLNTIGVNIRQIIVPKEAEDILKGAATVKLSEEQQLEILNIFSLSRDELLNQMKLAGRNPVIVGGGSLSTFEVGVPPYPKVYDIKAMSKQDQINALHKFGKLHVNRTDDGIGVDELMTLVSGGPWTWFFNLKDDRVAKISFSNIALNGEGWRLCYPGGIVHGAFLNASHGVCIAHVTGPEIWSMRYESSDIKESKLLGTNPWVDFSKELPVLLEYI